MTAKVIHFSYFTKFLPTGLTLFLRRYEKTMFIVSARCALPRSGKILLTVGGA
jgi:hypothetical protein